MSRVSIIVPVYNVEKYLKRCLDSLLKQTYEDIEIIIVDDGSTDGSTSICEEYCKKYRNVLMFRENNQGLSVARNTGIGLSSGDYVMFVDSDDWIESDMIEKMLNRSLYDDSDMVICGYVKKDVNTEAVIDTTKLSEGVISDIQAIRNLYDPVLNTPYVVVWNKLYRRKVIDNNTFPAGKKFEDDLAIHKIYSKCNRISVESSQMYNYSYRKTSIINTVASIEMIDCVESEYLRLLYFEDNNRYSCFVKKSVNTFFNRVLVTVTHLNKDAILNKRYKEMMRMEQDICKKHWREMSAKSILICLAPGVAKMAYKTLKNVKS